MSTTFAASSATVAHGGRDVLTPAIRGVLECAAAGLTDKEIAQREGVSVRTIRFHFTHARTRLGARTRLQAMAIAASTGMVRVPRRRPRPRSR